MKLLIVLSFWLLKKMDFIVSVIFDMNYMQSVKDRIKTHRLLAKIKDLEIEIELQKSRSEKFRTQLQKCEDAKNEIFIKEDDSL